MLLETASKPPTQKLQKKNQMMGNGFWTPNKLNFEFDKKNPELGFGSEERTEEQLEFKAGTLDTYQRKKKSIKEESRSDMVEDW